MKKMNIAILIAIALSLAMHQLYSQTTPDTSGKVFKNIVRYDFSGALFFGLDQHIVFGYERILTYNQSFSINVGKASLFTADRGDVKTDSFTFNDDVKNTGFKANIDYRFYLKKENKFQAPHGLYIGPFMSFANFKRDNQWAYNDATSQGNLINTSLRMNVFTMGGEMGYQFILGKRIALDLVLIGPGFGLYDLEAKVESALSEEEKEQLRGAIKDLITEKFPGLNKILANRNFDNEGTIHTWNLGFRYIIHIGYLF